MLWDCTLQTPSQPDAKAASHDIRSPTPAREAERLQCCLTSMPIRRIPTAPRCLLCLLHLLLSRVINDRGDEAIIFEIIKNVWAEVFVLNLKVYLVSLTIFDSGLTTRLVVNCWHHVFESCKNKLYFCHFE